MSDRPHLGAVLRTGLAAARLPLLGGSCAARLASEELAREAFAGWCRRTFRALGVELEIEHQNDGGWPAEPCVYVQLNQSSLIEAMVWPLILPERQRTIINLEFALYPFLGWAMWASSGIAIVRQWQKHACAGLTRAEAELRAGKSIGISIEGRRSKDGRLSPFKKGPVVLALKTGAPIVPIVFHGARERLPRGAVCVRSGRITARLCRAIHTKGLTYADRDAVIAQLAEVAQRELARVPAERHEANSSDAKHGIELQANRALNW